MKKEEIQHTFRHMPCLQTARLYLRPMRIQDAADMYAYASLPQVTRYLLWREHPDIQHTQRYLTYLSGRYRMGEFYDWALVLQESGHMIGTCGFTRIDPDNNVAEVGYVLNPRYWNRGLASEALTAVMHFAFERLGVHRVEARYMKDNLASRRVMEKCGMRFEGVLRAAIFAKGRYEDVGVCACLSDEWATRPALY